MPERIVATVPPEATTERILSQQAMGSVQLMEEAKEQEQDLSC